MTQSPQRPPASPPPAPPRVPPVPPPPGVRVPPTGTPQAGATQAGATQSGATQKMQPMTMPMPPAPGTAPSAAPKAATAARTAAPPPGSAPTAGHPTLKQLVQEANDTGVSDLHLGVNEKPRFRKRGEIETLDYPVTDLNTFTSWMKECMSDEEIRRFQDHLDFDGAFDFGFVRVRINCLDSLAGPAMVLRLIPSKIMTMEQLNLPPVFRDVCHYHKGLILVTGPTGSGKSTTMAAMIDYINKNMAYNIITIEDPVEFVHVSQKSLIKHREVGRHTLEFKNALKAALREDPDLMLVGEIRDQETMNIALKAASTGHLVMGTLHTNSAVKTIERIMGMFPPAEQPALRVSLAESLVSIIAQGLCKTTDGKRAAFHDILIATDAVKEYVVKGDMEAITEIMMRSEFDGMITMNKALYRLYQEGRITEETALEKSPTPNEMAQFLRGRI